MRAPVRRTAVATATGHPAQTLRKTNASGLAAGKMWSGAGSATDPWENSPRHAAIATAAAAKLPPTRLSNGSDLTGRRRRDGHPPMHVPAQSSGAASIAKNMFDEFSEAMSSVAGGDSAAEEEAVDPAVIGPQSPMHLLDRDTLTFLAGQTDANALSRRRSVKFGDER
mmetsp:Transcript_27912/g.73244  ORF Transcript_27912/g.73244 Transcript_27912/m.73244 type:complete len:168 (+) Transcript_27912:200-703(+)